VRRRRSFESALAELVDGLDGASVRYMLIGGLAASLRARPRFTHDIDATILLAPDRVPDLLARLAPRFRAAVPRVAAFARRNGVIPLLGPGDTRVDLLIAAHSFERAALRRATRMRVFGRPVRVCLAEDLVVYKMGAMGPRDLEDVSALLAAPRSGIDRGRLDRRIRRLARDLGREEILETWRGLFPPRRPPR
jgi:uncharacterized nucleotidyltransferase DUF6036